MVEDLPMAKIAEVCREHGIISLSVFGSLLTDRFDPKTSDADFIADFGREVKSTDVREVRKKLSGLLGLEVDLFSARALSRSRHKDFKKEIQKSCEVLYAE